jgi:nitrogen-specific signal transduction histidine kinase
LFLDIVRRLVQRNNGQIDVKSEPGRTEFRVCLPIADAQNAGATA